MPDFVTILTKQQKGLPLSATEADNNLIALRNGINSLHTTLSDFQVAVQRDFQDTGEDVSAAQTAATQAAAAAAQVRTDLTAEIADARSDADTAIGAINASLGTINTTLSGHTGSLSTLTTKVATAESSINTLQSGKADTTHVHAIADVTGLQTFLDGVASGSHTHTIANVTGLQTVLDGKADSAHTHVIGDTTGLQTALDAKAPLVGGKIPDQYLPALAITNVFPVADQAEMLALTAESGDVASYMTTVNSEQVRVTFILKQAPASEITNWLQLNTSVGGGVVSFKGRVGTVEPTADDYAIADITGLTTALAGKAASTHGHAIADITGLQTALDTLAGQAPTLPDQMSIRTTSTDVAPGSTVMLYETIPADRVYGVSVTPVTPPGTNDNMTVRFWGDENAPNDFTKMLYSSTFTNALPADTSQAWFYRDTKKTKKLRISITNNGGSTLTGVQIDIVAEPF